MTKLGIVVVVRVGHNVARFTFNPNFALDSTGNPKIESDTTKKDVATDASLPVLTIKGRKGGGERADPVVSKDHAAGPLDDGRGA